MFKPNWDALTSILGSSYLGSEVLDSKVRYLAVLFRTLYKYADDAFKQVLRQEFIPYITVMVDRFENCLLLPLSKFDYLQYQPSEQAKVLSIFAVLSSYLSILSLSIQMEHIHLNRNNSALEKTIKYILQLSMLMSSSQ